MGLIGLICFGLIVTPIAAENEISSNDTNQTTVNGSQTPVEMIVQSMKVKITQRSQIHQQ